MTGRSEAVLAIDIGGTKIAFAEVIGNRVSNRRQIPTPRSGGGDALVDAIAAEIKSVRPARFAVAATGIVSDGMLTALNPVTLPIEDRYPLAARLTLATGMNPVVVNDAQAAAWGEYTFGAGRGCRSFMFVTVSTGVGGGLVFGGRLQIGAVGLAGHVGHMTVPGGLGCGCGRHGCLETIASGTSIARRFSELAGGRLGRRLSSMPPHRVMLKRTALSKMQPRHLPKPSGMRSRPLMLIGSPSAAVLGWRLAFWSASASMLGSCPIFSSAQSWPPRQGTTPE